MFLTTGITAVNEYVCIDNVRDQQFAVNNYYLRTYLSITTDCLFVVIYNKTKQSYCVQNIK